MSLKHEPASEPLDISDSSALASLHDRRRLPQVPPERMHTDPGIVVFLSESGSENYFTNAFILRVIDSGLLEGVPREQKMLKGHLPRVTYHQVY